MAAAAAVPTAAPAAVPALTGTANAAGAEDGGLLLYNGQIVSGVILDDTGAATVGPYLTWLLVRNGVIESVGGADSNSPAPTQSTAQHRFSARVDLGGKRVLPGLHDAHIHVEMTGKLLTQVACGGATSVADVQTRLKAYLSAHPGTGVVQGFGWDQDSLGRYLTRHDLDAVSGPTRPVLLMRVCQHIGVANTAMLKLAGINALTADPVGGVIDRETTGAIAAAAGAKLFGEPNGVLRETAVELCAKWTHDASDSTRLTHIRAGLAQCLAYGLTAVQTNDAGSWHLYSQLARAHELPLRVYLTINQQEMTLPGRPKPGERVGELLQTHRVKIFADGSLGAETAALSAPYLSLMPSHQACSHNHDHKADGGHKRHSPTRVKAEAEATAHKPAAAAAAVAVQPVASPAAAAAATTAAQQPEQLDGCGVLIQSATVLNAMVRDAHSAGWRIEMHVIGDRAAEYGLNAFEAAKIPAASRPILTHCQVLRADLLPRMKRAGVIADVQPQFVTTDSAWAEKRLPKRLLSYAYCWQTLLRHGIAVAGGSDSPIEIANPFVGMYAAVYRPLQHPKSTDAAAPDAVSTADSAAADAAVGVAGAKRKADVTATGDADKKQHTATGAKALSTSVAANANAATDTAAAAAAAPHAIESWQWHAHECLTPAQALHLYTAAAAHCAGEEKRLGRLGAGFVADFVVCSEDVWAHPHRLAYACAEHVWVAGVLRK